MKLLLDIRYTGDKRIVFDPDGIETIEEIEPIACLITMKSGKAFLVEETMQEIRKQLHDIVEIEEIWRNKA